MGNKTIWIVLAVVVAGGLAFFATQQKQQPTSTTTEVVVSPTEVVQQESTAEGDAMMKKEDTAVTVTDAGFTPQAVTVKAGTKVVWTNKSGATANVSSAMHPTHRVYPPLNLGSFEDGEEVSLVFDTPGTYKYHNHLNPSQTASVVVE